MVDFNIIVTFLIPCHAPEQPHFLNLVGWPITAAVSYVGWFRFRCPVRAFCLTPNFLFFLLHNQSQPPCLTIICITRGPPLYS